MRTEKKSFKGVWIPSRILIKTKADGWSGAMKLFYGEVFALSKGKRGCTASNTHFAEHLDVTENYISKMIGHLVEMGEMVSEFDGNKRSLKICKNSKRANGLQSNRGLDSSPIANGLQSNRGLDSSPCSSIVQSKIKSKLKVKREIAFASQKKGTVQIHQHDPGNCEVQDEREVRTKDLREINLEFQRGVHLSTGEKRVRAQKYHAALEKYGEAAYRELEELMKQKIPYGMFLKVGAIVRENFPRIAKRHKDRLEIFDEKAERAARAMLDESDVLDVREYILWLIPLLQEKGLGTFAWGHVASGTWIDQFLLSSKQTKKVSAKQLGVDELEAIRDRFLKKKAARNNSV